MSRTNLDDVESFLNRSLCIKGEPGIHLCRNFAGNDFEYLFSESGQKLIKCRINLFVDRTTLLFAIRNGRVDEAAILGQLGSGEKQRWIRCSILWLELADG